MKKRFKFLTILSGVFLLTGCYVDLGFIKFGTPDEEEGGSVTPGTSGEYYKSYDLTLTGGRLLNELQKMSWEKHTNWITYGQIASYYEKKDDHDSVDEISDGSSKYQLFYTGKEKTTYTSSVENREHVWPCANSSTLWTHDKPQSGSFNPHYVDSSSYVGGGSDLYHVRPCDGAVNTARGNARFVDFDDPEFTSKKNDVIEYGQSGGKYNVLLYGADPTSSGGYEFADYCEPDDAFKGDIARLVLYVYMHYTERGITPDGGVKKGSNTYKYSDMTGSLSLSGIMGYNDEDRCKEVLKSWNKIDPDRKSVV